MGLKCRHGCTPKRKQQPLNFSFNQNSNLLLEKRHGRNLSASPVKNNSSNSTFDPFGHVGGFLWEKSFEFLYLIAGSENNVRIFTIETCFDIFPATVLWPYICIMLYAVVLKSKHVTGSVDLQPALKWIRTRAFSFYHLPTQ